MVMSFVFICFMNCRHAEIEPKDDAGSSSPTTVSSSITEDIRGINVSTSPLKQERKDDIR